MPVTAFSPEHAQGVADLIVPIQREEFGVPVTLADQPDLAAHRFYEKNGFVRVEAADLPSTYPRMAVDTVFYRLDLA